MIAKTIIGLTAGLFLASTGFAATYDEGILGDLSNNRLAPTPFLLGAPSNLLAGSVTLGERDYFTITVPDGMALNEIILSRYESSNARAFIGIQAGSSVTVDPAGSTSDGLLGYMHFGFDQSVPSDLLDDLSQSLPAGFPIPLPAGNYSFWINQTEPALTSYEFNFTTAVVIPSDYNSDGHVDAADYTIWRDSLGQVATIHGSGADGDADGMIDSDDYEVWKFGFEHSSADSRIASPAPEPGTVWLVGWLLGTISFQLAGHRHTSGFAG